jgi:hypothetical protein
VKLRRKAAQDKVLGIPLKEHLTETHTADAGLVNISPPNLAASAETACGVNGTRLRLPRKRSSAPSRGPYLRLSVVRVSLLRGFRAIPSSNVRLAIQSGGFPPPCEGRLPPLRRDVWTI